MKERLGKRRKSESECLEHFAASVGDFIRYWGFRRIHGQIWAVLYLHSQALSGAEITRILKVSKALVSPALSELESYGLIVPAGGDDKTKLYKAEPDVFRVIREVLRTREKKMIERAQECFKELKAVRKLEPDSALSAQRLAALEILIQTGLNGINLVLQLSRGPDDRSWENYASH